MAGDITLRFGFPAGSAASMPSSALDLVVHRVAVGFVDSSSLPISVMDQSKQEFPPTPCCSLEPATLS
jgi:hypothetical protein